MCCGEMLVVVDGIDELTINKLGSLWVVFEGVTSFNYDVPKWGSLSVTDIKNGMFSEAVHSTATVTTSRNGACHVWINGMFSGTPSSHTCIRIHTNTFRFSLNFYLISIEGLNASRIEPTQILDSIPIQTRIWCSKDRVGRYRQLITHCDDNYPSRCKYI